MRIYRTDGTYQDKPSDNGFGWYLSDVNSILKQEILTEGDLTPTPVLPESNSNFLESQPEHNDDSGSRHDLPTKIMANLNIIPHIKEEIPHHSTIHKQPVEGYIESAEAHFFSFAQNINIPPKEQLMALISPVNPETKALLSVVSCTRYSRLNDKDTNEEILKTLNLKTTNSRHFISEKLPCRDSVYNNENICVPNINFQLSIDSEIDVEREMACEICDYHNNKEDHMLSLMMELINTDLESNISDASYLNISLEECKDVNVAPLETSDLGNSIESSIISKEENCSRNKYRTSSYLDVPNRSDILASIGLNSEIDRSIEIFFQEKVELHHQINSIKESFEEDEKKINNLRLEAASFQNDLRETIYLSNLIHLLNGNLDKVKNTRLPFRMFRASIEHEEANENLIL